jgi:hypothetical protein
LVACFPPPPPRQLSRSFIQKKCGEKFKEYIIIRSKTINRNKIFLRIVEHEEFYLIGVDIMECEWYYDQYD